MTQDRAPLETAEVVARSIGRLIADACPPGWGFVLTLGTYGEGGCVTYLSNIEREDAIKMLREMIQKIESGRDTL